MSHYKNASSAIQRAKILRFLKRKKNKGTTLRELTQELAILSPGKRISELIEKGVKIKKVWEKYFDEFGIPHRIKRYWLLREK